MNKYIISFFGLYFLFFNTVSFSMELTRQQQEKGKGKESDVCSMENDEDICLMEDDEINQKLDSLAAGITEHQKDLFELEKQIKFQHDRISKLGPPNESKGKESRDLLVEADQISNKLRPWANSATERINNLLLRASQIKSQYQSIQQEENNETYNETSDRLKFLIRELNKRQEGIESINKQIESQEQIIQEQIISESKRQKDLELSQQTTAESSTPELQEGSSSQQQIQSPAPWLTDRMATSLTDSIPEVKGLIKSIEDKLIHYTYIRLLFTGRPGTGKTTLAIAFAKKLEIDIEILSPSSESNSYQFCLQQFIKKSLEPIIRLKKKCIVFIDEIDQLNSSKANEPVNPSYALNTYMDMTENNDGANPIPNIIFIGSTNNEKNIPDQLLSRLRVIEVQPPDDELRSTILTDLITSVAVDIIDTSECKTNPVKKTLVSKTKNFSIRNLNDLFILAQENATLDPKKENPPKLKQEHVIKAINKVWPRTLAAEKYWPYIARDWFKNAGTKYGPAIFLSTVGSAIFAGINWKVSRADRAREEERYQNQQKQYLEQRERDEEHYQEQKSISYHRYIMSL